MFDAWPCFYSNVFLLLLFACTHGALHYYVYISCCTAYKSFEHTELYFNEHLTPLQVNADIEELKALFNKGVIYSVFILVYLSDFVPAVLWIVDISKE